jgi:hypothetical protein
LKLEKTTAIFISFATNVASTHWPSSREFSWAITYPPNVFRDDGDTSQEAVTHSLKTRDFQSAERITYGRPDSAFDVRVRIRDANRGCPIDICRLRMDSTGVYAVAALKRRVNVRSGRRERHVIAVTGFLVWKFLRSNSRVLKRAIQYVNAHHPMSFRHSVAFSKGR